MFGSFDYIVNNRVYFQLGYVFYEKRKYDKISAFTQNWTLILTRCNSKGCVQGVLGCKYHPQLLLVQEYINTIIITVSHFVGKYTDYVPSQFEVPVVGA